MVSLNRHYEAWGPPVSQVSFRVGHALEAVIQDGDRVSVARGGATDLAVEVFRGEDALLGLGAVRRHFGGLIIEEDPRAYEDRLRHVAAKLDDPGTTLVWLDADDPDIDGAIGDRLEHVPGTRLIVAITGADPKQRRQVSWRCFGHGFESRHASREYFDVPPRFTSREQWIAYIRDLPTTRPDDLFIRFTINGDNIEVREGELAFKSGWHLCVANVYRWGIPGECSKVGVAREHAALTGSMISESTKSIASGYIAIDE